MEEKYLTSEFIDIELEMLPVPPGTPPSPRPPDRPRENFDDWPNCDDDARPETPK